MVIFRGGGRCQISKSERLVKEATVIGAFMNDIMSLGLVKTFHFFANLVYEVERGKRFFVNFLFLIDKSIHLRDRVASMGESRKMFADYI